MKKGFGFVKVFFIGVLAIGLFGLLSFVVASSDAPNPGHQSAEICDFSFCVLPLGFVRIGLGNWGLELMAEDLYALGGLLTLSSAVAGGNAKAYLHLYEFFSESKLSFLYESYETFEKGAWTIATDEDALTGGAPLKIGTTYLGVNNRLDLELSNDLIFSDGSRQNTAAPGNCVTVTQSTTTASIVATCPLGSTLTGGGCSLTAGRSVQTTYPNNNGWVCTYGGSGTFTMTAYAICCS